MVGTLTSVHTGWLTLSQALLKYTSSEDSYPMPFQKGMLISLPQYSSRREVDLIAGD
jgi:hypothetical protein